MRERLKSDQLEPTLEQVAANVSGEPNLRIRLFLLRAHAAQTEPRAGLFAPSTAAKKAII